MDILALLKTFIYMISTSLLLPVLLLLSLLIVWLAVYSGNFFALWLGRRRIPQKIDVIAALNEQRFAELSLPVKRFCSRMEELSSQGKRTEISVLNLLRDVEHRMWKSLDHLKMLIRIGPGLGLIGTLIPMGTGLASLGQGDLTRLSGDLVIAFTTTVVGMTLGLTSYFFFTIQRRWVEEDIRNMELLCELEMQTNESDYPMAIK